MKKKPLGVVVQRLWGEVQTPQLRVVVQEALGRGADTSFWVVAQGALGQGANTLDFGVCFEKAGACVLKTRGLVFSNAVFYDFPPQIRTLRFFYHLR